MKYLVPVLMCLALAAPVAASAQKPDMSCVKGDCKKTDPAAEAEKEMLKSSGQPIPIEAPVEGAGEAEPVKAGTTAMPAKPMMPEDAIREVQKAVDSDTAKYGTGFGESKARSFAPSTQRESCNPFGEDRRAASRAAAERALQYAEAQRATTAKIGDQVRLHMEEQIRIRNLLSDNVAKHQQEQRQQELASAEYQRSLKEEGLRIRDRVTGEARAHMEHQLTLRCLPRERFTTSYKATP